MRYLRSLIIVAVIIIISHCGHMPDMHYYTFNYSPALQRTQSSFDGTIGVSKFSALAPYDQDRIVYRRSPHEVEFYHYHRWIMPPGDLIQQKLWADLDESHLFRRVVLYPTNNDIDFLLRGHILQMEEWDEEDKWMAHFKIQVEIIDIKTNNPLLQNIFTEQEQITERSAVGVVKAINSCLQRCSGKMLSQLENLR